MKLFTEELFDKPVCN